MAVIYGIICLLNKAISCINERHCNVMRDEKIEKEMYKIAKDFIEKR